MTVDIVFLHGGGQGGWVWDETIAQMRAQSGDGVRCLALDAPGCGAKRGRDTSGMTFADVSRELVGDIAAAGVRDVVLVGHSQAGMTMPDMAALAPGLFRKLVFVTCSAPVEGRTTIETMGTSQAGTNPDEVGWPIDPATTTMAERYRAMFCNDMSEGQADAFLAQLGADMWPMCCYTQRNWPRDHLADLPVTFVVCESDASLPVAWQETFAGRLHADKLVRLDAGHQVMNTRPRSLAEVLLAEIAG